MSTPRGLFFVATSMWGVLLGLWASAASAEGISYGVPLGFIDTAAHFAVSPAMSGFLLAAGFMGLLIEMQTLHGIAGLIGLSALALFFGTHIYDGYVDAFVLAPAIFGLLCILFELHVLPGNGFAGIVGVFAVLASVLLAFGGQPLDVVLEACGIAVLLCAVSTYAMLKIWPTSAFFRMLTLTDAQGADFVASSDHGGLLGRVGTALSPLRPGGVADIEGERADVLTEGDFIEAGTPVRVSRVEGRRIFVKALAKENT